MNPNPEWIVTGTGRCGTGFVASLFSGLDIECTHEGLFTPRGIDPNWNSPPGTDRFEVRRADSSWMAAPHLHRYDCPIIMLLRDPVCVVQSLLGIQFFTTPGPYRDYLFQYEPDLAKLDPVNASWQFYVWWNRRIQPYATIVMSSYAYTGQYNTWFTLTSLEKFVGLTFEGHYDGLAAALYSNQALVNSRPRASLSAAMEGVDLDLVDEAYSIFAPYREVTSIP